jgi:hypothetical protein
MDLLEERLPELSLTVDVARDAFFDRCESLASANGWRVDRRREYAGPGYDQLNLHLEPGVPGYPMLRMVATPGDPKRLGLDVVTSWSSRPLRYHEYLTAARASYRRLFDAYEKAYGKRLRLGVPRRPRTLDLATLDCNRISYAGEKFRGLYRTLAVGEGDARDRLINAFSTFHVIRPKDLPPPLREHLEWVYEQITRKPGRHRFEGSVEATVRAMKNATAARILERILDIADAIAVIEEICNRRRAAG